ncbi:kinase-like domain-containing protein [Pelagophyceae sp. CCMP2097]|nr:kinase-like domain-containing protein [Pelagophyceae sp. CCMP2097]
MASDASPSRRGPRISFFSFLIPGPKGEKRDGAARGPAPLAGSTSTAGEEAGSPTVSHSSASDGSSAPSVYDDPPSICDDPPSVVVDDPPLRPRESASESDLQLRGSASFDIRLHESASESNLLDCQLVEPAAPAPVLRRAAAALPPLRPAGGAPARVPRPPRPPARVRSMSVQETSSKDFEPLRLLGKGAFGSVVEVRKRGGHTQGKRYAMKVMSKLDLLERGHAEAARVEREVLRSIRHPFLVALCYAFQSRSKVYLVTELFEGGSLDRALATGGGGAAVAARIGAQCALAMAHLHARGVIHRDIKAANVLLDARGDAHLADYGLAAYCDRERLQAPRRSFCGTIEYMAPELLRDTAQYTAAVDWWALGVLVYETVHGDYTPFHSKTPRDLFSKILHAEPQFDDRFDAASAGCVCALLAKDPAERAGLAQLKAQGFLEIALQAARVPGLAALGGGDGDAAGAEGHERSRRLACLDGSVSGDMDLAKFRQDAFFGFAYKQDSTAAAADAERVSEGSGPPTADEKPSPASPAAKKPRRNFLHGFALSNITTQLRRRTASTAPVAKATGAAQPAQATSPSRRDSV